MDFCSLYSTAVSIVNHMQRMDRGGELEVLEDDCVRKGRRGALKGEHTRVDGIALAAWNVRKCRRTFAWLTYRLMPRGSKQE